MVRNTVVFVIGAIAALVAGLFAERKIAHASGGGPKFLFESILKLQFPFGGPGMGSNIRVVGGSITITNKSPWSSEPDQTTELTSTGVDAWTYGLEFCRQKPGGPQTTLLVYPHLSNTWSVVELMNPEGTNRGVKISGIAGDTPRSGTVVFDTINGADTFSKTSPPDQKPATYAYQNATCASHDKCPGETVREIQVYVGGSVTPDVWYCSDGHCHVDIGAQIKPPST